MDLTARDHANCRTAHLSNPFFKMEPWLTALKEIGFLSGEDRVTIKDIRKKYLVDPRSLDNVRYMVVLITCVREKFESARSMVVEDESGSMDCILKVPTTDGPHGYLATLSAGAVLVLNKPFFCSLSRLKPYIILLKSMIERIYWVEYQNQSSSADVEILATQLLRTQRATPAVLQCCPESEELPESTLTDEESLHEQLKERMLQTIRKDLDLLKSGLSGVASCLL